MKNQLLLTLLCSCLTVLPSLTLATERAVISSINVELVSPSSDGVGLKLVKTWYNVQVGSDVRVICTAGIEVTEKYSDDEKIKIEHNATWSFSKDLGHGVESWAMKKDDKSFDDKSFDVKSIATNRSRCKLTRQYQTDLDDDKWVDQGEIKCTSEIILLNMVFDQSGYYECHSNLLVLKSGDVVNNSSSSAHVLLNVRQKEMSTFVITTVTLVVLGLFVVVIISFKFSGRHFSWEKSNAGTGVHLSSSFDSEFNRDQHWHHRGRSNSSVSAMSGIVFQANPESMARLMERLQKVDNDSPTDSSISALPERNGNQTIAHKDEKKETKDETLKSVEDQEPKGLVRKTSGSLKLEKRSENKQAKPNLYRHSSLGILPSTIAIGSGLYLDDPYEDLMKMRRESGGVKSNKVNHNGPGIIGLRQPQSSTTPNTSHRSEFSTLTQNRNGNVYTPTRGRHGHIDDHRRCSLHARTPGFRGFRDVSISSARSRLNSEDETILEERIDDDEADKQKSTLSHQI